MRNSANEVIELTNDNTLSAYQITELTPVLLENMQNMAHTEHSHDEEFKCQVQEMQENFTRMKQHGQIPKYLQKLGII